MASRKQIVIQGKMIDSNLEPVLNLRVEVWDKDKFVDDKLGEATTDKKGSFRITIKQEEYKVHFVDEHPDLYFKIYSEDQLIKSTEDSILWNFERAPGDLEIVVDPKQKGSAGSRTSSGKEAKATQATKPDTKLDRLVINKSYQVSGHVTNVSGVPLRNYVVDVYNRFVNSSVQLGTSATDEKGFYSLIVSPTGLKSLPDLEVRTYNADDRKTITVSEIAYNVVDKAVIDVIVPVSRGAGLSEFVSVLNTLKPHLGDVAITSIREDSSTKQVSYLSNKAGYDPRIVAMNVSAHQIGQSLGVDPSHMYALFRSGVPGTESAVKSLSSAKIESALAKAVEKGIIASNSGVQDTIKAISAKSVDYVLNTKPESAISTMSEMLGTRLTDAQKKIFADSFKQFGTDSAKFWADLEQRGISKGTIASLQLDGKLGYLTGQNATLVKKLYSSFSISKDQDLVINGLYKAANWKKLIGNTVPATLTADEYANHMANQVKLSYPTAVAAEMINKGEVSLGANIPTAELYSFFNKNQSKSIIGRMPVKEWDGFKDLSVPAKAAAKTFERLYQISPSDESLMALSKAGITSAYQIARFTKTEFFAAHGKSFPSTEEAENSFIKASEVYSSSLNIATGYITQRSSPNVYAITGALAKTQNQTIAYPTLEELFGNMDYCACDHCKSVLSPAAYLVELLQFIDLTGIPFSKTNPITALKNRRPDIENIQLSCENTNMALPYIDLVNEILEYYILHGNLTNLEGHDVPEDTQQADLLAEPQFVEKSVYETQLKSKVFPYNLPFHQPLETLRRIFNVWDVSMEKCLAVFSTPLASRKEAVLTNEQEYKTLTDVTFKKLPLYFGEPENNTIAQLNAAISNGKVFSRRAGVSYEDLVELLKTEFINPGFDLTPAFQKLKLSLVDLQKFYDGVITGPQLDAMIPSTINPAEYGGNVKNWLTNNRQLIMGLIMLTDVGPASSECNFADVALRYALPDTTLNSLTTTSYHKFHRFLRLMTKTGWSIATLDSVVTPLLPIASNTITDGNIDATFKTLIDRIANFRKLASLLSYSEKKYPQLLLILDGSNGFELRQEQLARILKMSIADMQELSILTGIDPLAADLETDEPSLIRFISLAQLLKANGLKVVDLAYILRHQDTSGKLMPAAEVLLKNIKLIKDALNLVEKENSITPGNADFNFAKSKMLLVFDAATTDNFFGLLLGTKTYSEEFITPEEELPESMVEADANLSFDPFKKTLSYTGILTAAAKTTIEASVTALVKEDLHEGATNGELATFKTDVNAVLSLIFTSGNADLTNLGSTYPTLTTIFNAVKAELTPADQAKKIVDMILPELKARLKENAIRQALIAILKADEEIVRVLISDKSVVQSAADAGKGVSYDFTKLESTITFSENKTYNFYLDVPATDDYILYVAGPETRTISLSVDGNLLINNVAIGSSKELSGAISLKAGALHSVSLTVASLAPGEAATLSWRTKGLAKESIPASAIYAGDKVEFARASLNRLSKAIHFNKLFKFTPLELEYFSKANTATKNFINEIPVASGIATPALNALWAKVELLTHFIAIRKENEPEENTWLSVMLNPDLKNAQNKYVLESFNMWQEADLVSVLGKFGYTRSSIAEIGKLKKVIDAMNLITAIGYPAAQSLTWMSNDPSYDLVAGIKAEIKANVTEAAWLETMQSVNDVVRNMLRDALVSYILQYQKPSPEIITPDKLYEYFLIDVEMDACMKTSRIRQALSTVQLFIQRCLMNLEPSVDPASIRAEQWTWMKRYRVWEANRKVFLYPENWLEPELRDNKSSMFKELEGELMQQEITDESAELAFLNYLKKLDDIAKLEMVGMYLEENEKGNQDDDILHVIGRTMGNTRQHYYRRYEYGYWTPWEKISLNIEGEHIFPVVWRKRLFIFWATTFEKAKSGDRNAMPTTLGGQAWGLSALKDVEVNLCWGEYYKGKWTSPKSNDMSRPMVINDLGGFNPKTLLVYGRKEKVENPVGKFRERLIFYIRYRGGGATASTKRNAVLTFTSKNAPPFLEYTDDNLLYDQVRNYVTHTYLDPYDGTGNGAALHNTQFILPGKSFKIGVDQPAGAAKPVEIENLFTKKSMLKDEFSVLPVWHPVENQYEAPFSYADEHSTLFGKPDETVTYVRDIDIYYPVFDPVIISDPPLLIEEPIPGWPPVNEFENQFEDIVDNPWRWTDNVQHRNTNFNVLLPEGSTFTFGNTTFGNVGKNLTTNPKTF